MKTMISKNPYLIRFNAEDRKRNGKAKALANAPAILSQIKKLDKYQPTWAMRNMIKALEIHSFQNTTEEWTRYYESKIILKLRALGRIPKNLERAIA